MPLFYRTQEVLTCLMQKLHSKLQTFSNPQNSMVWPGHLRRRSELPKFNKLALDSSASCWFAGVFVYTVMSHCWFSIDNDHHHDNEQVVAVSVADIARVPGCHKRPYIPDLQRWDFTVGLGSLRDFEVNLEGYSFMKTVAYRLYRTRTFLT